MKRFAQLLELLALTPSRTRKLAALTRYFRAVPDPDRGYALAALCGEMSLPGVKPAALREMVGARVDPELFGWSYDYVGDLAETIALIWPPDAAKAHAPPRLSEPRNVEADAHAVDTSSDTVRPEASTLIFSAAMSCASING